MAGLAASATTASAPSSVGVIAVRPTAAPVAASLGKETAAVSSVAATHSVRGSPLNVRI